MRAGGMKPVNEFRDRCEAQEWRSYSCRQEDDQCRPPPLLPGPKEGNRRDDPEAPPPTPRSCADEQSCGEEPGRKKYENIAMTHFDREQQPVSTQVHAIPIPLQGRTLKEYIGARTIGYSGCHLQGSVARSPESAVQRAGQVSASLMALMGSRRIPYKKQVSANPYKPPPIPTRHGNTPEKGVRADQLIGFPGITKCRNNRRRSPCSRTSMEGPALDEGQRESRENCYT